MAHREEEGDKQAEYEAARAKMAAAKQVTRMEVEQATWMATTVAATHMASREWSIRRLIHHSRTSISLFHVQVVELRFILLCCFVELLNCDELHVHGFEGLHLPSMAVL